MLNTIQNSLNQNRVTIPDPGNVVRLIDVPRSSVSLSTTDFLKLNIEPIGSPLILDTLTNNIYPDYTKELYHLENLKKRTENLVNLCKKDDFNYLEKSFDPKPFNNFDYLKSLNKKDDLNYPEKSFDLKSLNLDYLKSFLD